MVEWGQEAGQSSADEREVCGRLQVKGLTLPYDIPRESNERRWSPSSWKSSVGVQTNAFKYYLKNDWDVNAEHRRIIESDLDEILIAGHQTEVNTVRVMRRSANRLMRESGSKPWRTLRIRRERNAPIGNLDRKFGSFRYTSWWSLKLILRRQPGPTPIVDSI